MAGSRYSFFSRRCLMAAMKSFVRTAFASMPSTSPTRESLRTDAINWLFVHLEQLVCFLFVEGVLVWYAFLLGKDKFASWVPALTGLGVCCLIIVAEFLIDGKWLIGGSRVSLWIVYPVMAAALGLIAFMENRANKALYSLSK